MSFPKTILAIDPGSRESAWVRLRVEGLVVEGKGISTNEKIREWLPRARSVAELLVLEFPKAYVLRAKSGSNFMPQQVVVTAFEIGRLAESWGARTSSSTAAR